MGLEARLKRLELLALAALMAKRPRAEAPKRVVVVQVMYEAGPDGEPPMLGERYEYVLPLDAPGGRPC